MTKAQDDKIESITQGETASLNFSPIFVQLYTNLSLYHLVPYTFCLNEMRLMMAVFWYKKPCCPMYTDVSDGLAGPPSRQTHKNF